MPETDWLLDVCSEHNVDEKIFTKILRINFVFPNLNEEQGQ